MIGYTGIIMSYVRPSVMLCIVALRVGVNGSKLYQRVPDTKDT